MILCSKLVDSKKALNGLSVDDSCPICVDEWSKIQEPSIAIILSCKHACCARCLLYYKNKHDAEESSLCCGLCRRPISVTVFDETVHFIFKHNVIESFTELVKHLPFSQEMVEKTTLNLLIKNEFDISKVDTVLFGMIGLFSSELECGTKKLNPNEKNEYYMEARRPVQLLEQEFLAMRQDINKLDSDSKEWSLKNKQMKEILNKLELVRRNAASDIFERINSHGHMGTVTDDNEICIDLHGLHINEAKWMIDDRVLPILQVFKQLVLITGSGSHNKSGEPVLKNAVKTYLIEKNIKVEQVGKNSGALRILYSN